MGTITLSNAWLSPLDSGDRRYIDWLRGALILRVVLAHLGLSWIMVPYSTYIGMFFPSLFAVSGIVAFYSFSRSHNLRIFVSRRLIRLYVPYVVITILAFMILAAVTGVWSPSFYVLIDWALMNMRPADEPYHLGQVWFLQSLVLITIMALPFYVLSRISIHFLLMPVAISLALAIGQSYWYIGGHFRLDLGSFNSLSLYDPLVNFGYYMFGAWIFATGLHKSAKFGISTLGVLLIALLLLVTTGDIDPDLRNHSYYQTVYYMILGFVGIVGLFLFRPVLERIFSFSPIGPSLQFFSVHAFVIFLIHSFFIEFSEDVFGWTNVIEAPGLAAAKVTFVLTATCLAAIPLSWATKKLTRGAIRLGHATQQDMRRQNGSS